MATQIKFELRSGTSTQWLEANPILRQGEPGVETNSRRFKVGDGQTFWLDLPYYLNEDAVSLMISEAMANAAPISPEQIDEIIVQVKSGLTLPDLVARYESAKA